ncbi:MAG: glycoside hydrolase family 15 protein [bacterium]|nr:glycoside hydrolase family 15 protein [bacterium]
MKTVILSNGNVNIGLNEFGLVSDFYFPDNGYENHTLGDELFHRIGLMVDGEFSWLNSGEWRFEFDYFSDALISKIRAQNERLQIQLEFRDAILQDKDVFVREIRVVNLNNFSRQIQLFFHQNFAINSSKHLADTAQFIPESNVILHYRGKRAFVISAEQKTKNGIGQISFRKFNQHTVGLFGDENKAGFKAGSWMDAEDGVLAGANVEHGQTDSTLGFSFILKENAEEIFQYSISCADDHALAFENSKKISGANFEKEIAKTHRAWQKWLAPANKIAKRLPQKYQKKFIQSVMLVKSHIASSGAPIASNDSEMLHHARDDYSYCWPRDALFAIWPLIRIGYFEEAEKFFEFCSKAKNPAGFMNHKYLPNGEIGPSWHPYSQGGDSQNLPIQIDETAGIIFLYAQFHAKFKNTAALNKFYPELIRPMANFLADFIDKNGLVKPNYELWEMDFISSTYSNAITFAALNSAAELAREFGAVKDAYKWRLKAEKLQNAAKTQLFDTQNRYFYRGIWPNGEKDSKIDISSFYGAFMFGLFELNSPEVSQALNRLEEHFSANSQIGIPRFEQDVYYHFGDYEANIWPIASLWRAEFYLARAEKQKAEEILDWVANRSSSTGILPEQIDPRDLSWLSVAPLTWSQAEFISALLDFVAIS